MTLISPQWALPANIFAYSTTRQGGISEGNYGELNVGNHVGDDVNRVVANRQQLPYAEKIVWLNQVHGDRSIVLPSAELDADAAISCTTDFACAVMTADCVPVLIADVNGQEVAAVHAGWKGLVNHIIAKTIAHMRTPAQQLTAWVGPAISQQHYEVPFAVSDQFSSWPQAVRPSGNEGKYLLDLPAIAAQQLQAAGLPCVVNAGLCTYANEHQFFSHRRATHQQQEQCGRQVSVIGFKS